MSTKQYNSKKESEIKLRNKTQHSLKHVQGEKKVGIMIKLLINNLKQSNFNFNVK